MRLWSARRSRRSIARSPKRRRNDSRRSRRKTTAVSPLRDSSRNGSDGSISLTKPPGAWGTAPTVGTLTVSYESVIDIVPPGAVVGPRRGGGTAGDLSVRVAFAHDNRAICELIG